MFDKKVHQVSVSNCIYCWYYYRVKRCIFRNSWSIINNFCPWYPFTKSLIKNSLLYIIIITLPLLQIDSHRLYLPQDMELEMVSLEDLLVLEYGIFFVLIQIKDPVINSSKLRSRYFTDIS